jgi:BRCA1-associated protein
MSPSLSDRKGKPQRSSSRHRNRSSSIHSFNAEVLICPVCLDPMDVDVSYYTKSNTTTHNAIENSATFTTVYKHTLHMHCLLQWEYAPCPVCRFDHAGLNEIN